MGFHADPDQTPAQRPMTGLSKPTLYKSHCLGPLHTSPTSPLGRKNRVLTGTMDTIDELDLIAKKEHSGVNHRSDVQHDVPAVFLCM